MPKGRKSPASSSRTSSHEFDPGWGDHALIWVRVLPVWVVAVAPLSLGVWLVVRGEFLGLLLIAFGVLFAAVGAGVTFGAITAPRRRVEVDTGRGVISLEYVCLQRYFVPWPRRRLTIRFDEVTAVRRQEIRGRYGAEAPYWMLDIYTRNGCVRVDAWLSGFGDLSTSLLKLAGDRPVPMMHRPMVVIGLVGLCVGGLTVVVCLALGWP